VKNEMTQIIDTWLVRT